MDYPIAPVPFTAVSLKDLFWRSRLETNRTVTIPDVLSKCQENGRIDNFRKAAGLMEGPYRGKMTFEDSDVYKVIEGVSYSLAQEYDADLDSQLDRLISIIAQAQEPDGYLYTNRTIDPGHPHVNAGPQRWSNLVMSHELYVCGHLYEAAVAHFQSTGKRTLFEVALKSADLVCRTFGPQGRHDVPGHQIIEMALVRLYRLTGCHRYLDTALFFLEQRGHHENRVPYAYEGNPGYCQDHLPLVHQKTAVGHAVRAMYMYCGMTDVAAMDRDSVYARTIGYLWQAILTHKLYVTGGVGARHIGEAFGEDFELPNLTAYNETCAAIGSVMWNHRLFLLEGEAKYFDVLEQTLYNGLLSGVSLSGTRYFYANPLACDGSFKFNSDSMTRQGWFDVSCCPTNLCRFFPSLPGYIYAVREQDVYVNLYIQSSVRLETGSGQVFLSQSSNYPWESSIQITVRPVSKTRLTLLLRLPSWIGDQSMGSPLYPFGHPVSSPVRIALNGEPIAFQVRHGYAAIEREWVPQDVVSLDLPLEVRRIHCDFRVLENRGKTALQRGPLVYCFEQIDNPIPVDTVSLRSTDVFTACYEPDVLGGVTVLKSENLTAVPYFAWSNRGEGKMAIWVLDGA